MPTAVLTAFQLPQLVSVCDPQLTAACGGEAWKGFSLTCYVSRVPLTEPGRGLLRGRSGRWARGLPAEGTLPAPAQPASATQRAVAHHQGLCAGLTIVFKREAKYPTVMHYRLAEFFLVLQTQPQYLFVGCF